MIILIHIKLQVGIRVPILNIKGKITWYPVSWSWLSQWLHTRVYILMVHTPGSMYIMANVIVNYHNRFNISADHLPCLLVSAAVGLVPIATTLAIGLYPGWPGNAFSLLSRQCRLLRMFWNRFLGMISLKDGVRARNVCAPAPCWGLPDHIHGQQQAKESM